MADDLFARESRNAISAITYLLKQTRQRVEDDVNVKRLIERRPIAALAAAAGGGLVTGLLIVPSRQAREAQEAEAVHHHKRSTSEMLQRQLIAAVAPSLQMFVTAAAESFFSEHPFRSRKPHRQDLAPIPAPPSPPS